MISGHALNPDGKKMSKSKGKVSGDPLIALEQYSADELRYWSCSSKLGSDVLFSEEVLGDGRRLVTKLWNAVKFATVHLEDFDPELEPELRPYDRWILSRFTIAAERATNGMEQYEYSVAMNRAEYFFWKVLCDNYLEIVKKRLYSDDDPAGKQSAQYALYRIIYGSLRLFAPVLVHVTEELYQAIFRKYEGHESLHLAKWPNPDFMDEEALKYGDMSLQIIEEARKFKSEQNLSMAAPLKTVEVNAPAEDLGGLRRFQDDLIAVTRAENILWTEGTRLAVLVVPAND